MKVAILTKEGFKIQEKDVNFCDSDHVLIKTASCGICDGDVFQYLNRGEIGSEGLLLGHEETAL